MAQGRASVKRRGKYRVKLTADERAELKRLVRKGKAAGWKLTRARALLKCDESEPSLVSGAGWSDARIAQALDVTTRSLENWRKQAVERGPLSLLERKPQDGSKRRKLDGAGEAQLVKLACSSPPEGRSRWTMQLLADELVALEVVDAVSDETVRRVLKKHAKALATSDVVHPAGAGRGVCSGDGAGSPGV